MCVRSFVAKIFRRRENFGGAKIYEKKSSSRRDQFRPRIVKIETILAVFGSFELLKIHMPLFGEFSRSSRDLYRTPLQIELFPGRLSKFFEKWRVAF